MLCDTSSRGRLSANKPVSHGPPFLLHSHRVDIHFLSVLFLPSCSVGVVCHCARQGNIINMSVNSYKFCHFSKIFFIIVFRWSCLNCRLRCPTLPPRFLVVLQRFIRTCKLSGQKYEWNYAENEQKAPSQPVAHKWALTQHQNIRSYPRKLFSSYSAVLTALALP